MRIGLGLGVGRPRGRASAWWLNSAYEGMAAIADFNNDRYAITTVELANVATATAAELTTLRSATRDEFFSAYTAASTTARTYVDSTGTLKNDLLANVPRFDYANGKRQLLLENQSTNLFLNSLTPATQTISVTSGTVYTVSVRGTGSITLSGAGTGTVTQASPVTVTASSASLTATVTGSLSAMQCEAQSFASMIIPTTSAAVTRAIETFRLSPLVEAILQRAEGGVVVRGQGYNHSGQGRLIGGPTFHRLFGTDGNSPNILRVGTSETLNLGIVTPPVGAYGVSAAWDGTGKSAAQSGIGTTSINSNTNSLDADRSIVYLARDGNGNYGNGRYDFLGILASRPSNTRLQELAVAA